MVFIKICVGSSCHLKGSEQIVELLKKTVEEQGLEDEVVLSASFCFGKCNRVGVTVQVNDEVITGVTPERFDEFFRMHVLPQVGKQG